MGQLFESALEEIQLLKKTYNQLFDSFQNCHDALIESNERIAELEKENKRESMELRSRLGSALGRNSEYNSAIENMQQKLAKANERVKELEAKENLTILTNHEATLNSDYGKKWLNKFALEQQIEGIESSIAYAEGKSHFVDVSDLQDYIEQLRKEQENG